MPGNRKKMQLADFTVDDQGRVAPCPKGILPSRVNKTRVFIVLLLLQSFAEIVPTISSAQRQRVKWPIITDSRKKTYVLLVEDCTRIPMHSKKSTFSRWS